MKKVIKPNQRQSNHMIKKIIKEETSNHHNPSLWDKENNLTEEEKQKLIDLHKKYVGIINNKIDDVRNLFRNSDEIKGLMNVIDDIYNNQSSLEGEYHENDYERYAHDLLSDLLDDTNNNLMDLFWD
jgi:hypothetical protein